MIMKHWRAVLLCIGFWATGCADSGESIMLPLVAEVDGVAHSNSSSDLSLRLRVEVQMLARNGSRIVQEFTGFEDAPASAFEGLVAPGVAANIRANHLPRNNDALSHSNVAMGNASERISSLLGVGEMGRRGRTYTSQNALVREVSYAHRGVDVLRYKLTGQQSPGREPEYAWLLASESICDSMVGDDTHWPDECIEGFDPEFDAGEIEILIASILIELSSLDPWFGVLSLPSATLLGEEPPYNPYHCKVQKYAHNVAVGNAVYFSAATIYWAARKNSVRARNNLGAAAGALAAANITYVALAECLNSPYV
jgi:hypothetical protein